MIYYTADLHLGHKNVLKFDGRPFESIEEHDEFLIGQWNARVRPDDQVYILGDFSVRSEKSPISYLKRLNGKKYLIRGNHDSALVNDPETAACFERIEKMCFIRDREYPIVLCHFPICEWNRYHRGSWHIYGHIHNKKNRAFEFMKQEERALNAGIMINNYQPVTMEELIFNNQIFKETETDYWKLYGEHTGPMELEDGSWILPEINSFTGEAYMEQGDMNYIFSEYTSFGLHYRFYINGKPDHAHSFDEVLRQAFYHGPAFEIREKDKSEYSWQELHFLEKLTGKADE